MRTPIDTEKRAPSAPTELPALPSVNESTLVSAVSKLKEIVETREGRRGSKYEQVVTWRDLYNVGLVAINSNGSWNLGAANGTVQGVTLINNVPALRDALEESIRNSTAFQRLIARIGSAEDTKGMPDEVISLLKNSIADEAIARGAAISDIRSTIQDNNRSFAMRVEEVTASLADAHSGIRQISYASATQNAATAGQITTVQARLDNFGGSGITVESKMTATVSRLDGMSGVYSVKIDGAGKFAGFQLAVDAPIGVTPYSSFLINADKFAIFTSGGNFSPFGADASGVYLNGSVRINTGATINLSTIAANAAVPAVTYIGSYSSAPGGATLNNVYKNTSDNNTYIYNGSSWVLFIPPGTRGSMTFYTSGSSWSDTTANSVVSSVTGSSTKIIGDTVTISTTGFAATKYWSGTAWVDPGVTIDGNLLVSGTVSASKIVGGSFAGQTFTGGTFNGASIGAAGSLAVIGNVNFYTTGMAPVFSVAGSTGVATFGNANKLVVNSTALEVNTAQTVTYGSGIPLTVDSTNSANAGALVKNSALGKEIVLGGTYCAYSASGKGKIYILDGNGPFTGFHDGLISKDVGTDVGDIVVVESILYKHDVSNTLAKVTVSSKPYQKTVYGVVSDRGVPDNHLEVPYEMWWGLIHDHDLVTVNGIGEGQINVCGQNGDIEAGDYIVTSSIPGKGMRQDDDIMRSYTVAKATESVAFSSPTEVKMIACIYVAS